MQRRMPPDTNRENPGEGGSGDWSWASAVQGEPRIAGKYQPLGERQNQLTF